MKVTMRAAGEMTVRASANCVSSSVGDEAVILDLDNGVYYGLNEVGARVWALIQTPQTVAALRDAILGEYAATREQCECDLNDLLIQMRALRLMEAGGS